MRTTSAIQRVLTASDGTTNGSALGYRLAPDVVLAIAWDGSGRLIDLGGGCYGLPATSARLLEIVLCEGPGAAVARVASDYAVPAGRVRDDWDAFRKDLLRLGLLVPPGRRVEQRGPVGRVRARAVARTLRFVLRVFRSDRRKATALLAFAWVCLKCSGWAKTIELWRDANIGQAGGDTAAGDPERLESIHRAVREAVARSVFPVDCKARALCCWALLRSAGQPACVVVGIDLFPFLGHCWCESGARTLGDEGERSGRFTPILEYV